MIIVGFEAITAAIVTVIFSMTGPEVATIAAAESHDPERAVAKAANSVILRIAIFYVGSMFLLVTIVPWNDQALAASPYVAAFSEMGLPYANHVMNAVVSTAVLSCLNSGMYTASRMLFVLAARREAPQQFVRVSRRGVPTVAILVSSIVGFLCVIAAAVSSDTVFSLLLNSSGAVILFVYCLIGISQVVLRYRNGSAGLKVKMWLFPALSIFTVAAIVTILAQMGIRADSCLQLVLSLLSWAVVIVLYLVNKWMINRRPDADGATQTTPCPEFWCWPTKPPSLRSCCPNCAESAPPVPRSTSSSYPTVRSKRVWLRHTGPLTCGRRLSKPPRPDSTTPVEAMRSEQLDVEAMRSEQLDVEGVRGDFRPLRALAKAVDAFQSDQIVIATLPPEQSVWHRFDVVDHARGDYPDIAVTHIVATPRRPSGPGAVTAVAGLSARQQGGAPLHLATPIARTTARKVNCTIKFGESRARRRRSDRARAASPNDALTLPR